MFLQPATQAHTKKKNFFKFSQHDLPVTRPDTLPLSYRRLEEVRPINMAQQFLGSLSGQGRLYKYLVDGKPMK